MSELKICPFCRCGEQSMGEHVGFDDLGNQPPSSFSVLCLGCGAEGAECETEKAAAEAWNARADDWVPVGDLEPPKDKAFLSWSEDGPVVLQWCDNFMQFVLPNQVGDFYVSRYWPEFTHWKPIAAPEVE